MHSFLGSGGFIPPSKEVPPPVAFTATGGTITDEERGGVEGKLHTFTSSGNFVVEGGSRDDVAVELIAGGGSGGFSTSATVAGGGSAGRRMVVTGISVDDTTGTYAIVVGTGGAPQTVQDPGISGTASSAFGTTNSDVGVGGGAQARDGGNGVSGWNGGGGNAAGAGAQGAGGVGASGRNGGAGRGDATTSNRSAGGGAGEGGPGVNGTLSSAGAGGPGVQSDFVDTPMDCCAGGGGASLGAPSVGVGGAYGGGDGSRTGSSEAGAGSSPGSGGGGTRNSSEGSGAGADGIVRIWYPTATADVQRPLITSAYISLTQGGPEL